MKLRATIPAPSTPTSSRVRDRLYGERRIEATPIGPGTPTVLGARYRLLERHGSGGTADVYRARDERLKRDVAVKVIAAWLAEDPATVRRFLREAELCARLEHPSVAAVLDAGNRPREYIVMELVDGQDAAPLLKRDHPFTPVQAVGCWCRSARRSTMRTAAASSTETSRRATS
jgi:serine/threonine protein kinase